METKRNFSEFLGLIALIIAASGMIAMLGSSIINLSFFEGKDVIWDSIGIIGSLAFITPFFFFQFIIPSGLFGIKNDIPKWGKIVIYLLVFPLINLWTLSSLDAAFHFLPDFRAAMENGASKIIVQTMREQWHDQGWTIMLITYVIMVGSGLVFKNIFKYRLEEKAA